MGIITQGIPAEIALELAKLNGSTVFIETGTYHGDTTRWAAQYFEAVYTIERSAYLFEQHQADLSQLKNVRSYLGDSRDVLPGLLDQLGDRKAIYWLDSHWSGGETAGERDPCPLLGELACLAERSQDVILIDDARLFLSAPHQLHDPAQWPTIADIAEALPSATGRMYLQVIDDVIFAVPNQDPVKSGLVRYAQERSTSFWIEFSKYQKGKSRLPFLKKIAWSLRRKLR